MKNKDKRTSDPVITCSMLNILEYFFKKINVEILPKDRPVSNKNG
jgi:hypothetical protein